MIFTEVMLKTIRWASRILCLIFILFISLFAFDVVGQNAGFWRTAGAFLMHLLPAFIMVAILVVAWKRPLIGGIVFLIIGFSYVIWSAGNGKVYPAISVPLFTIAILFLISWLAENQRKEKREEL